MKELFLTGTYSEPILFGTGEVFAGKGEGVYLCAFEDGRISVLDCLKLSNPSFVTINEEKKHIYAVNELKEFQGEYGGGLTDISYDGNGKMTVIAGFPTGGTDPCNVAVSRDGKNVCIANYADGKVTVFPLDENGNVLARRTVYQHEKRDSIAGIVPERQEGPHAHSIIFDGKDRMFAVDLGIDRMKAYVVREDGIFPDDKHTAVLAAGSGPRTGEWSADGKHFYVINELGCSVTHLTYDGDMLSVKESVPILPGELTEDASAADLHLGRDGRFLYASLRGMNSLAVFKVEDDGTLTFKSRISCGGKTPRNFAIDPSGQYLLCGNQDSDSITIFRIGGDGSLTFLEKKDFPTPVCIRFFKQ